MNTCVITKPGTLNYEATEAINTIATNISFLGRDRKKLLVTSCTMEEGKSYVAMQIMLNMAKRGRNVVLVDMDLRRSYMTTRFGVELSGEGLGLSNYLAGFCPMSEILYKTDVEGAYIIPIGREVANPLALLDSPALKELLDALAEQFDTVLVDAPPIGMVVDAASIASNCEGIIFVVEYAKRHREELRDSVRQLQQTGCPVLGVIFNKVTIESLSDRKYYSKRYSHYGKYSRYGRYGSRYYKKSSDNKKKKSIID